MKRPNKLAWVLIIIGPPLLVSRPLFNEWRYAKLRNLYECTPRSCRLDLDGNGNRESVLITSPTDGREELILLEGNETILRLPYQYTDGTFRTHMAVRAEGGRDRLLIFDGLRHSPALRKAFVWTGTKVEQLDVSALDEDIVNAMAARDDAGTFSTWVAFQLITLSLLTVYYLIVGAYFLWSHTQKGAPTQTAA